MKLTSTISMAATERTEEHAMPVALITGAARGLGRASALALAERGWPLIVDARHEHDLTNAISGIDGVVAIPGDVTDPGHRASLAAAVDRLGPLGVLVRNASTPGGRPAPPLLAYDPRRLRPRYEVNCFAALAL